MEVEEEVEEEAPIEEEPTPEPEPEPKGKLVYTGRGPMYRMPDGTLVPAN